MGKRFFDYNPYTKTTQWFIDNEDGGFSIAYEQDCQDIIDANKEKASHGRDYYVSKDHEGEYWKAASIPLNIWMTWLNEDGIDYFAPEHSKDLERKLNDPEWKYLKCAEIII